MSRKIAKNSLPFVLMSVALLAGCGARPAEPSEDSDIDSVGFGIGSANGLRPDALDPGNLAAAPLDPNKLDEQDLAAIQDTSPNGDLHRRFLEYAIGCALRPDQSFTFTYRGAPDPVTYIGKHGLAPQWAESPLDDVGQAWVSACLAARTNWYGKRVPIWLQGAAEPLGDSAAGASETFEEGAFWGNLFADTPSLSACYVPGTEAGARADYRDCAAGHINADTGQVETCGLIEIVGSCDAACDSLNSDGYHPACGAPSPDLPSTEKTKYVITVFLD